MNAASEILAALGDEPSLAKTISAAGRLSEVRDNRQKINFSILRNFTVEPGLSAAISTASARAGLSSAINLADYNDVEGAAFARDSATYASEPDIVVLAMHLQSMIPALRISFASMSVEEIKRTTTAALERLIALTRAIRDRTDALILVHNFDQPPYPAYGILDAQLSFGQRRTIATLNADLAEVLATIRGAYIVDVERLVGELGYRVATDSRFWHLARSPYTFAFHQRLAREYVAFAAALKGRAKKCLVLDCDNTLWGGVLGEEGLHGIALGPTSPGSAFLETHAAIINYYERGVLLALCSKNDRADVVEVFASHPASLLKLEHFVALRVNWSDKASNIREIATELNIGLDSIVFVDDNPFERDLVRSLLPEVAVVDLPKDPSRYAATLEGLAYFETLTLSEEDRRRSEMYRAESERKAFRSEAGSVESYLQSLDMQLTVAMADTSQIPRIAQLTQKTNQFNLTTRRYTESDIAGMTTDASWSVYYAELRDRFDSAGIVAIALLHHEGVCSYIDSFLMSCRVIGRGVEDALLGIIVRDCKEMGVHVLAADFFQTAKNGLAKTFLSDSGFQPHSPVDERGWSLDVSTASLEVPRWFTAIAQTRTQVA